MEGKREVVVETVNDVLMWACDARWMTWEVISWDSGPEFRWFLSSHSNGDLAERNKRLSSWSPTRIFASSKN